MNNKNITKLEIDLENYYPLAFTLNVMELIQEEYGTMDNWTELVNGQGETNVKALKFGLTEMINEGIDIENENNKQKKDFVNLKQVGRILTEVGLSKGGAKVVESMNKALKTDKKEKNV